MSYLVKDVQTNELVTISGLWTLGPLLVHDRGLWEVVIDGLLFQLETQAPLPQRYHGRIRYPLYRLVIVTNHTLRLKKLHELYAANV